MKLIFFVVTFGSIYDRVLSLIEEKKDKGEIIVVAATDQIESFFKNYTNFKVIRTKVYPDLITRKTKYKILSNIIRSKIEYTKLFKDIEDSEIYFFNRGCAVVIFGYVKKLSKKNKVFLIQSSEFNDKLTYPIEHSFRAFLMRWITKWMLNVETYIINNMGAPFWMLDEKFYRNMDIISGYKGNKKLLKKYMKNIDILKGKKILLAIEDSIAANTIVESEFINKMDTMMDMLNNYASGAYAIKPHPRLNRLYGKMSQCTEIVPPYIPFELILNHDWEVVIGINSAALISATRMTNAKVISLIDSVKFRDGKIKRMYRDWLEEETKGTIEFLGNMEDLKRLLEQLNVGD